MKRLAIFAAVLFVAACAPKADDAAAGDSAAPAAMPAPAMDSAAAPAMDSAAAKDSAKQ